MLVDAGNTAAEGWQQLDHIVAALVEALPVFNPILLAAPPAGFRQTGSKIPRQSHRYSGRTAMLAAVNVHEPKPPADPDSPLAFSMEGYDGRPPANLIQRFWAPGWNSVQALNKFQAEIGGPLRGGDPGRRLIEPAPDAAIAYFKALPAAAPAAGEWSLVAVHHIFGSEELSMAAPGVAQRSPQPYLGLNAEDAAELGISAGEEAEVTWDSRRHRLPVRLMPSLPRRVAGMPVGLPGWPALNLPAYAKIFRGGRDV
jgi:NADH-quinone oxidoreductase subunit G